MPTIPRCRFPESVKRNGDSTIPSHRDESDPIASQIDRLALLAGIRGNDQTRDEYRRLAALVRRSCATSNADLGALLARPELETETRRNLEAIHVAGAWVLVEAGIADLPADLRALVDTGTVTLEQLGLLHDSLGIVTAADIDAALEQGAIEALLGDDGVVAVRAAISQLRAVPAGIPLGRADALAQRVLACLRARSGGAWALPVGSLRRGEEMVGGIGILAPGAGRNALDDIAALEDVQAVRHRSPQRLSVVMNGTQVDIRTPSALAGEAALLYLTGSRAHVAALQHRAGHAGLRLGIDGLRTPDGRTVATHEEEIYKALDLPFIAPELRGGDSILDEAGRGRLPQLITRSDIRGDLHLHTHWSDGRDSVDAMVGACVALGYEYMAITDHSPSSSASRSLTLDAVSRQADEIALARETYPQIEILHGCEVDILSDGRLDFPDHVLRRFDVVLASLHDRAGQAPTRLLHRYLSAMRHPLVSIITHPANRQVPRRPGYELDFATLFEAAVETRTVLEIDGAPTHLDLDATLARQAAAANVMLSIDSDAHRTESLDAHMRLGLLLARRGRVEPRHVLNARPYRQVKGILTAKRRGLPR